jgi:hypothetical protein
VPNDVEPFVWTSLHIPEDTMRLWLVRGKRNVVRITVHNDSGRLQRGTVQVELEGVRPVSFAYDLGPLTASTHEITIEIPNDWPFGLRTMHITGTANGKRLFSQHPKVRIAPGPVVEFIGNSWVEQLHTVERRQAGGAPSVRFGQEWTYKFDLSRAVRAELQCDVGAHQGRYWSVQASRDGQSWKTILEGRSPRAWHQVDLTEWCGSTLYLRFKGNDEQLGELVLMTERANRDNAD